MMSVEHLTVRAGTFSLSDISFRIETGQYAVLMGRTGCGKTSLLEAVCGLRRVTAGRIVCRGDDVTHWDPADRHVGYVPQDLALFPTFSVREHLEFALRIRRAATALIKQRVDDLAELLGITGLLSRTIAGLSGGERQRVALGRALSFEPSVLLLDEPLSALDDATRNDLYSLLKKLQVRTGVTTLHVTHNREEAAVLADRLFVLDAGQLVEQTAVK
ncbi:MAG: ABC transporter ATP-binding protein [Planctomycetaceae bacterium]|nr:ABC transporter ATP-binding protein [Planctomycetaceae bacterium]